MAEGQTPPGWYPDTQTPGQQRYWDGAQWTDNYAPLAPVGAKKGHGCLYVFLGALAGVAVLAVGVVAVLGTAATHVSDDFTESQRQARKEVKITECTRNDRGDVLGVRGTVHNTTSGRSTYVIDVVVLGGSGAQLDSRTTAAIDVDPGQTASWAVPATAKSAPGITCKITNVIRTAA